MADYIFGTNSGKCAKRVEIPRQQGGCYDTMKNAPVLGTVQRKTAKAVSVAMMCALCLLAGPQAFAEAGPWEAAEGEMRLVLSEAFYRFVAGDREAAKDYVNRAWNGHYLGAFEDEVKSRISPERAENI
ncbi:MAG: hypothetical protein LBK61_04250, partial [Spirochaetaceae bacterium]|nr:hypothetical protein [Spirochaetaceae bacterium]